MNSFRTQTRRSSTLKNVSLGLGTVQDALSRYSTRLQMVCEPRVEEEANHLYVPAPKPSKLLLEYLNSPEPKIGKEIQLGKRNALNRRSLNGYFVSNTKTSSIHLGLNSYKSISGIRVK